MSAENLQTDIGNVLYNILKTVILQNLPFFANKQKCERFSTTGNLLKDFAAQHGEQNILPLSLIFV